MVGFRASAVVGLDNRSHLEVGGANIVVGRRREVNREVFRTLLGRSLDYCSIDINLVQSVCHRKAGIRRDVHLLGERVLNRCCINRRLLGVDANRRARILSDHVVLPCR